MFWHFPNTGITKFYPLASKFRSFLFQLYMNFNEASIVFLFFFEVCLNVGLCCNNHLVFQDQTTSICWHQHFKESILLIALFSELPNLLKSFKLVWAYQPSFSSLV